jgi:hypothetical protein
MPPPESDADLIAAHDHWVRKVVADGWIPTEWGDLALKRSDQDKIKIAKGEGVEHDSATEEFYRRWVMRSIHEQLDEMK